MTSSIHPGFVTLHGNRTETLAEAVFAWLRQTPLGPLEEEVILVQSNSMAEWLKMMLASDCGVCAATRVELPARFMWRTYRQVLGRDQVPAHSPTDKTALTWRLMRLLPELLGTPAFAPVADFLQGDEPDRLYQLAGRLADLFDQYQVYRAQWLEDWAAGRDVLLSPGRPTLPVPADQLWQPLLWRRLLSELNESDLANIRPALHQRTIDTLQQGGPLSSPVARRVVLFGMSHVPLSTLQTAAALAGHSQVILAVPNPCRFHWADIMDGRELLQATRRRHPLRGGRDLAELPLDQMHAFAHPLLAAWGRQGRDFVRQLDEFDATQQARTQFALPRVDLFEEDDPLDAPLLNQVQNRIRDLVPLTEHPTVKANPADRSIVFHIAHSALREVEILHDQLLQLFATPMNGKSLQPRDVVVMVPDIGTVAPAIRAVFGQYGRHDARYIPFAITDLSARASSPVVTALEWLLRLPQKRCRLSELRDLLDVPAVAHRFGISQDALPRLTQWMAGAGIRWGLDETQRVNLGLGACGAQNTGWFGLRRMLLGYASGASPLADGGHASTSAFFGDIEPYVEVGGLDAELAGSLADLLGRLVSWCEIASKPAPPKDWAERGRTPMAEMMLATDESDRQLLSALDDALSAWSSACALGGFDGDVALSVAREAWLSTLEEPSLNTRFRAGGVTFCTLMPMRAIPFEVVCLLGMNDGDYPRRAMRSDFDLMGLPGQARAGDRSRRDDDRQLMLEALLSARGVLYVSWTGRNVRDNSEQPPSVLVSQLRDYLAAGWSGPVLAQRTTEHPLQPFSRRYFEPDSGLFTHAREWRAAHATVEDAGKAVMIPPMASFEPDPRVPLTVAQLVTFLRNPVKTFFQRRLNVYFDQEEEEVADDEVFGLDGLLEYGLIRELLTDVASGLGAGDAGELIENRLARLRREGRLPLGAMGDWAEAELASTLRPTLRAWQVVQVQYAQSTGRQRLNFAHEGVVLEDWLDQLRVGPASDELSDSLPTWLELDAGRLCSNPQKRIVRIDRMLAPWVRSVVAAACEVPAQGVMVGRDATLTISPMATDAARDTLCVLIQTWREGLNAPVPLPFRTALEQLQGGSPATVYEGGMRVQGEFQEPSLARMYPDFEAVTADGRFEALAHAVYAPLAQWVTDHVSASAHPDEETAEEAGAA